MHRALLAAALFITGLPAFAQIDYVARLAENEDLAKRLGLSKLSEAERSEWNRVLAAMYSMGAKSATRAPDAGDFPQIEQRSAKAESEASGAVAWISRADLDGEDIVKLRNGAIFQVSIGFVGIGMGRDAALIKEGSQWSLWIEGKREFHGELLRPPSVGTPISFRRASIQTVSSDGSIVRLIDGSVCEIDIVDRIHTMLWLAASEVFIINGKSIINPDDSSSEMVQFTRLR